MPRPTIAARACGSANGERLPRNSGTTCSPSTLRTTSEMDDTSASRCPVSSSDTGMPRSRASSFASAAAGWHSTRWSIAAPAADWPPSLSQAPGTIAE
jgi:hypothetical protein